jgi:hypothetical protein
VDRAIEEADVDPYQPEPRWNDKKCLVPTDPTPIAQEVYTFEPLFFSSGAGAGARLFAINVHHETYCTYQGINRLLVMFFDGVPVIQYQNKVFLHADKFSSDIRRISRRYS